MEETITKETPGCPHCHRPGAEYKGSGHSYDMQVVEIYVCGFCKTEFASAGETKTPETPGRSCGRCWRNTNNCPSENYIDGVCGVC